MITNNKDNMMRTTQRCLLMFMLLLSSVNGWAQNTYVLVTDASSLKDGDKIVIVSRENMYVMNTSSYNSHFGATIQSFDDVKTKTTIVSLKNDARIITLEGETGAWYFNIGSGYLYAASSSSSTLKANQTKNDET